MGEALCVYRLGGKEPIGEGKIENTEEKGGAKSMKVQRQQVERDRVKGKRETDLE